MLLAALPLFAMSTSNPSARSTLTAIKLIIGSSSITRILFFAFLFSMYHHILVLIGINREFDDKGCAFPRRAFSIQPAALFGDNPIADAQPETCPFTDFLRREEGVENTVNDIRRNPGAVIGK